MADTPNQTAQGALDVLVASDLAKANTTPSKMSPITNQNVLMDMEKLYQQKKAEKEYFLQDLADAQAWWSGGAAGPSVGLALRAQTRAQQAKDLQDLQMAISQGKVNIAQLNEAGASMSEPQQQIAGLTNRPAGAQPTSQAMPGAGFTIRGVQVPESVYRTYQAYLKQGNLAKATEAFEKYVNESTKGEISFATSPATYKQDDYWDKAAGEMDRKTPYETRGGVLQTPINKDTVSTNVDTPVKGFAANDQKVQKTEGGYKPIDGTSGAPVNYGINQKANPEVDVKSLTPAKATKIYEEKYWNAINADSLPPATARVAYDAAVNQGVDYAKKLIAQTGGDPIKMLDKREMDYIKLANSDPRQKENLQGWLNRVNEIRNELTQPSGEAPVTAVSSTGKPRTYSEYLSQQAGQKSFQEKAGAKSGEATGTRQGAFESAAVDAGKDLQNANVMLNIIDEHPEAVGLGYKNRALGTTIEGVKLLTGKDIEPLARRATLSPEAIEAGNKFDALAETNNLKFRQAVMKGTGQVSDFETKLTERASGLSKDNSVEANRFFATVAAENYRTLDKLGTEWQKFQQANPGTTFDKFEQSAIWKKAQAERENRLKQYFPEIERGDLAFGNRAPTKGAGDAEMEAWRKRYGTKKGD